MQKIDAKTTQLANDLHSAAIRLLRLVRSEDRLSGIGPAQLSALSVLVFAGSMSPARLAEAEQVSAPTMVRILRGLIAQALATSSPDPTDGRKLRVSATAKGQRVMFRVREKRVQKLAALLSEQPAAQRAQLADALEILQRLTAGGKAASR